MGQKILIVDDEIDLLEILAFNLQKAGFEVETATSGRAALDIIGRESVSLVLLDVMMNGMDGFQTARKLRLSGNTVPIIFLTARATESDVLEGFDNGGDDYIAKPFSVREVVARVKAILSRAPQTPMQLTFEEIKIDVAAKEVSVGGHSVPLTKTEFALLSMMIARAGKVISREEFIAKIWGTEVYVEERTVDVHIARLRKKLGAAGSYIVNRSGYGYCVES